MTNPRTGPGLPRAGIVSRPPAQQRLRRRGWPALLLLLLAGVVLPGGAAENVVISEFLAKNTTGITNDVDGAFSDWVELYNADTNMVNLEGWCLTDSALLPAKWVFPATNLAPGQFLVVWLSDKNRRVPGAPLHTNFKLSDEGEYLGLVWTDRVTVVSQFAPVFPPQFADISYGLAGMSSTNAYLTQPTPGAPNSVATNLVLEAPGFLPPRGFYSDLVRLKLVGAPDVTTYYTLDGTLPGPTNGFVYSQRIPLTNTTVVRAVSYKPNRLPSVVQTHTYLYLDSVIRQTGAGFPPTWGSNATPASYAMDTNIIDDPQWSANLKSDLRSLPTVSITMNTEHLFGTNGIYANPLGEGVAWERPCAVEYIPADCRPGFMINCGIRIQGSASRDPGFATKHNFRLLFKQIYGSGRLNAGLYPGSPVTEFDTLVLHAGFNDHWNWSGAHAEMQRDQWCADTQAAMGRQGTHGNYVSLYLNGLYWGLYNLGERPDASYAAHYYGGERSDYDAFNTDELVDGDTNHWNAMLEIVRAGITNEAAFAALSTHLDVPAFIDYLILEFFAGNDDWPGNNWRAAGSIPLGQPFRFFSWDAEFTLGLSLNQGLAPVDIDRTGVTNGVPGMIYGALRQHPDFGRMFGDRAQRLLFQDGLLTGDRCVARWRRRADEMGRAIVPESARWGRVGQTNYTRDHWLAEQSRVLTDWLPQRSAVVITQLQAAGLYPLVSAATVTPPGGVVSGLVPVSLAAPAGSIYYTTNGSDPRLPDGTVSPEALAYAGSLLVNEGLTLCSRVRLGQDWSALVVTEFLGTQSPIVFRGTITPLCGEDLEVAFLGRPSELHTLEFSTNLIDWTVRAPVRANEDGFCRFVESATHAPVRGYRLRWP